MHSLEGKHTSKQTNKQLMALNTIKETNKTGRESVLSYKERSNFMTSCKVNHFPKTLLPNAIVTDKVSIYNLEKDVNI